MKTKDEHHIPAGAPSHPDCEVQLSGKKGKASSIISYVANQLRWHMIDRHPEIGLRQRHDLLADFRAACDKGNYSEMLATVERWVVIR